eukprot:TRINITY_DN2333_c0_g2_i2.p1 TRINITY_DN2333_c0_g2~~TRINITY_DN2333_c0_g2_i2.p1  ORF type:complete len:246 (+),score=19.79 TRINITY_DN2333_c0_g2_i2:1-738(+)
MFYEVFFEIARLRLTKNCSYVTSSYNKLSTVRLRQHRLFALAKRFAVMLSTVTRSGLAACSAALGVASPLSRGYHEKVVDHYDNPRNVGSMDKKDPTVGTGLVGAPACGDVMKLQIQVDDDGNIVDAKFKTFGCGSAIASSSVATEWVRGKSLDEALTISNKQIAKHLSLPPVKLHCSMLAEDAIKAAVKDIQSRRAAKPEVDAANQCYCARFVRCRTCRIDCIHWSDMLKYDRCAACFSFNIIA